MKRFAICGRCGHRIPLTYGANREDWTWDSVSDEYLCEECAFKIDDHIHMYKPEVGEK